MVWEGKKVPPDLAMQWSSKLVQDWSSAVTKVQNMKTGSKFSGKTSNPQMQRWTPPRNGHIKINVDASVRPGSSSFSIGMMCRDSTGSFIWGKAMNFVGSVSSFEAEAVGVYEALMEACKGDTQHIVVECDSLLVVQALEGGSKIHSEVGYTLEACQEILKSKENIKVSYVKRLANRAAHLMARVPCSLNSYNYYETPPHCVLETIMYDVSGA